MPVIMKKKPNVKKAVAAVAAITKKHDDGSEEQEQEVLGHTMFDNPHVMIEYSMGMTKSIAKFEFIKFDVRITIPCEATAEDIEATYEQAKGWVDSKVSELNAEIVAQIEG